IGRLAHAQRSIGAVLARVNGLRVRPDLRCAHPMELLASGFGLIEAPRVDAAGHVYFSDVTGGSVYRLAPDGSRSTVVPKRRGVGGLALHAEGGVVVSGRDVVHVRDGVS